MNDVHFEIPKKVKFEPMLSDTGNEVNQDVLIRHLQDRISDLQDDNMRLRDNQQPKSFSHDVFNIEFDREKKLRHLF